jgi:hypothetical protein
MLVVRAASATPHVSERTDGTADKQGCLQERMNHSENRNEPARRRQSAATSKACQLLEILLADTMDDIQVVARELTFRDGMHARLHRALDDLIAHRRCWRQLQPNTGPHQRNVKLPHERHVPLIAKVRMTPRTVKTRP